jgi:hypothetical protein
MVEIFKIAETPEIERRRQYQVRQHQQECEQQEALALARTPAVSAT